MPRVPTRRRILKAASLAAVAPALRGFAAIEAIPKRFVFVVRSNGILAPEIQPVGLADLVKPRSNGGWATKGRIESLADHKLPPGLTKLAPFKDRLTIFQGLSGRMCTGSHNAGYGALGAYKSGQGTPPSSVTIDGMLAKHLESPFPHLGFAMEEIGPQVVYPPLSAAGPRKPLPYYADPMSAYRDLFGSILTDGELKGAVEIEKNLIDFMTRDVSSFQKSLPEHEQEKLGHYLEGFEAMKKRQKRLAAMKDQLRAAAPDLRESYESEIETERLEAHFEMATSALIGGLSQVVSIRADHMGMRLSGLGLGSKTVHQIGHMIEGQKGGSGGEAFDDGKGEFATRELILDYHSKLIAEMAAKLDAVPEGDGTMLDNTVIVYLSDHGDRHHSKFHEWPLIALGNVNGQAHAGSYIQFPGYASEGHRTIANFYLSLLHFAGIEAGETFGQIDMALPSNIDQHGPLAEWIA
ncbi:MAG: DUF1552 domain-containing protein [Verrucomicrobiota bacterium]